MKQCRLKLPAPAPPSSDASPPRDHQREAARLADLIDSLTEPGAVTRAANRLLSNEKSEMVNGDERFSEKKSDIIVSAGHTSEDKYG